MPGKVCLKDRGIWSFQSYGLGVAAAGNQNVTPGGGKPAPLPLSPRLQSIIVAAHAPPRYDARWHQLMKSLCYDPEAQLERE